MAYYSNGAFDVEHLYNMPIYLRNFYLKQLETTKKEEQDAVKKERERQQSKKR